MNIKFWFTFCFLLQLSLISTAQPQTNDQIVGLIHAFKQDVRGPYKDIRWFCKDGSVIPPKERCPKPGGLQRARYKDEVLNLAKNNHVFLGQILSTTPKEEFWDAANNQSRLKQYQIEKYLRLVDDGWILRRGQFYRGAVQEEDEENWGITFFYWLLDQDEIVEKNFFLLRQAVKDIPHQGDNSRSQKIRALSKVISDGYAPFLDLRVKIHSHPEKADIQKVISFRQKHRNSLSPNLYREMDQLIAEMEAAYEADNLLSVRKYVKTLPPDAPIANEIRNFLLLQTLSNPSPDRSTAMADLIWSIREQISNLPGGKNRLALLEISNILEQILFQDAINWEVQSANELREKICYLSEAAAGSGFLEKWEWEQINGRLSLPSTDSVSITHLQEYLDNARRIVEWGAATVRASYQDVIQLFSGFEPLAYGFLDDRIRSSTLLPLGQSVGQLGEFLGAQANLSNQVLDLSAQSHIRGLNPGYAMGELVVVENAPHEVEVQKDKIYVFNQAPADLKPVAGIATVSEGNLVSHVQLLARNLGIPNAVISTQNLKDLKRYAGEKVFYAVSNKGTVIMKPARQMNEEEKQLFVKKERNLERITVPIDKIELQQTNVLNLRELKASDSGKLCGPKAANLAQLKLMFPDQVVEGLVIPFGIFRQHMDQPMPDRRLSYWQYLNRIFAASDRLGKSGVSKEKVEAFVLQSLDTLRSAIKQIPLKPDFLTQVRTQFQDVFGKGLGEVPVFLRSDTNMEDLKSFTGAGLNLTLFNILDADRIIQGIKDVWASPYTERSYKWRQQYLLNPENVFPSILIIPAVDVDYSGVLITKGIHSGDEKDITIAFSRGAGGAVDGQAAESYLLSHSGENILLSPAREPHFNRLPLSGGIRKDHTTFEEPILNATNLADLRQFADQLKTVLPQVPGMESDGPFDVELGFKDQRIWLFQVRPFVENKQAVASTYLESITPKIPQGKMVSMHTPL